MSDDPEDTAAQNRRLPEELAAGAEASYWKGLAEGRLLMPRCRDCGQWHWPSVYRCSHCGSWEQGWEEVEPRGEVYTWTRTFHRFQGIDRIKHPFASVVVRLDPVGSHLMGMLELPAEDTPVAIGDRVKGRFDWVEAKRGTIPVIIWVQETDSSPD